MSPSRTFILRPVATSLLMAAILLAGFVAYLQLPVSALPEVDYPTIQVVTFYPGASPDVMASAVTAPLERQFGQVPGLNQMTSTSSDGSSIIVLQFSLELNIDVAEQEVQAAINAAQTYLPSDLPVPPIYSKTNPADTPILTLALSSKSIAAIAGRRSRRHPLRAKNLSTPRRRTGQHQWRAKAGRPSTRESHGAVLLRHQPRGCAHRPAANQPRPGEGQLRRPATGLPDSIERPTASAPISRKSSSPTTTGRRSNSRMWPRRTMTWKTIARRHGWTKLPRSSSTFNASPGQTSFRWSTASRNCFPC